MLELETSLSFGGGAVEPIELAPTGSQLPTGTDARVTGFGQHEAKPESPPNETLYSLSTKLVSSSECGGEAGAFLCASTSGGSAIR